MTTSHTFWQPAFAILSVDPFHLPVLPIWLFWRQISNFWVFSNSFGLFQLMKIILKSPHEFGLYGQLHFYVDLADSNMILADFWALADF